MNTPGDWQREIPGWPGAPNPTAPTAAWVVGLDTLARASSVAVGPIVTAAGVCGAITVVRCGKQPPLGFRELGILSQIGELAGAAADRLRGHGGAPLAG